MHDILYTCLDILPALVQSPSIDGHIIASGEDDTRHWMHGETANVVRMRLECGDFFVRVVVEYTSLDVVRALDKFDTSNRSPSAFNVCIIAPVSWVVDVGGAILESSQEPWLYGVNEIK